MDAIIIMILAEQIELIDAFIIHVFDNDIFWKHVVAHDRIGDGCCYYTDIGKRNKIKRCVCDTCVCYWHILD